MTPSKADDESWELRPRRVLEVGPGLGELVPAVLAAGCEMEIIGEPHHVKAILENYGEPGVQLSGVGGWFPEAMPSCTIPFDYIFASRVIHCHGLDEARRLVSAMVGFVKPGGKVVVETTSPWSSYYDVFWPRSLGRKSMS